MAESKGKWPGRVFVTRQLDKPVYKLLQALRVAHDLDQWTVLQAALVAFGSRPKMEREVFVKEVQLAPSDQPEEYPVRG